MTPKPWAVILIESQFYEYTVARRNPGTSTGISYIQKSEKTEYVGNLAQENTPVLWFDDRATAEHAVTVLQETFPKNSYAVCQTILVSYVPAAPAIRAAFGPAGLLPT